MKKWFPLLLALALCLMCTAALAETAECAHKEITYVPGEYGHVLNCIVCGWEWEEEEAHTFENGACSSCGYKEECYHTNSASYRCEKSDQFEHQVYCGDCNEYLGVRNKLEQTKVGWHKSTCTVCGMDVAEYTCIDACNDGNELCDGCGGATTQPDNYHPHEPHQSHCVREGNIHQVYCELCGGKTARLDIRFEYVDAETHMVGCWWCLDMGASGVEKEPHIITYDTIDTAHTAKCEKCGYESVAEPHTITYDTTNADHTAKCDVCGYKGAAEAHTYTDDKDNDCDICGKTKKCEHTYWYKVPKQATCTEEGLRVNYCNECGKEHGTQAIPAKGHDLTTEDKGDYILESCSRCDYENKIEKAPAEETPAEVAPVVDGLQIAEADEAVGLPETVNAAKAFTVAMIKDGQSVQPEEATTVTLTLTEEELAAVNGLKLVLVLADGTVTEIPYEVVEGQVVFTAEALGTFAFVAE